MHLLANTRWFNPEARLAAETLKHSENSLHHAVKAPLGLQVLVKMDLVYRGLLRLLRVGHELDLLLPGLHCSLPQLHEERGPTAIEHLGLRYRPGCRPALLCVLTCQWQLPLVIDSVAASSSAMGSVSDTTS